MICTSFKGCLSVKSAILSLYSQDMDHLMVTWFTGPSILFCSSSMSPEWLLNWCTFQRRTSKSDVQNDCHRIFIMAKVLVLNERVFKDLTVCTDMMFYGLGYMTGEGFKTFTEIFERQFISILKVQFSFFCVRCKFYYICWKFLEHFKRLLKILKGGLSVI